MRRRNVGLAIAFTALVDDEGTSCEVERVLVQEIARGLSFGSKREALVDALFAVRRALWQPVL